MTTLPRTHGRTTDRGTRGSTGARATYAVAITGLSPVLLLGAVLYHPHLDDLRNQGNVAEALVADTTRWGIAHLAVGVAAALVLVGFLEVDRFLRPDDGPGASAVGVPFVTVGTVLFAFLPAMEIAMLAVHGSGLEVAPVMEEMNAWFMPVLLGSATCFLVGVGLFARGVLRSTSVSGPVTWFVVPALVVAGLARFVPLGIALYVGMAALVVALGSLALAMRDPRVAHGPAPAR